MNTSLRSKITEALSSVLPITAIVLVLSVTIAPMPLDVLALFLAGAVLLILGMGLFSLGVDTAMTPFGEAAGVYMTRSRRIGLLLVVSLVTGALITIAEPDLQVLAELVPSIPNTVMIFTVAAGVGVFLVITMLRILFKIPLRYMLCGFYVLTFLLALFVPDDFIPVAFDAGGVTTGPVTVPFILALGVGMSSIRSDKDSYDDSFGLVALCSIGPILSVMLLGVVFRPSGAESAAAALSALADTGEVAGAFLTALPAYIGEVAVALLPIVAVFFIFNLIARRFRRRRLGRTVLGFLFTYVGLVLFLTGVNVGFMPAGSYMGAALADSEFRLLLVPVAMLMGCFIVMAEPSVHVLNHQVEAMTHGAVTQRAMKLSLSIGVAISAGLAMIRVLTGISIFWFLIPGYGLALVLSFFVPRIFTGIAFDSGGVASGPMTATFLLPFAQGACRSLGGNLMQDAFGVVAMVAMTPLITIQVMGLAYQKRMRAEQAARESAEALPDCIIDYEEVRCG